MRGQATTQFNWMFILIAGAVILLAIFGFIMRYRAAANRELAATFLDLVDEITTSAGIAKGTARIIDLPPLDVTLSCTEECTCQIEVLETANRGFEDKVIFGPPKTEGNIIVWAQEWSVPYRVKNFLYLTSKDVKYYIVGKPENARYQLLKEKLPDLLTVEFVTPDQMTAEEPTGQAQYRIVYLEANPAFNQWGNFAYEDVSLVHLTEESATFYAKRSDNSMSFTSGVEIPYVGEAAQYAAVFGDEQMFRCGLHKSAQRLHYISRVYLDKTSQLNDPDVCTVNYDRGIDALDRMITVSASLRGDLSRMQEIEDIMEQLKDANDRAGAHSCPYIY